MDNKQLLKVLKTVVRNEVRSVIKEELTEILKEGLHKTVTEINEDVNTDPVPSIKPIVKNKPKKKIEFKENKFSGILNETDSLKEQGPMVMNGGMGEGIPSVPDYAELMTEDITMTSADAINFGAQRKMQNGQHVQPNGPIVATMDDPETGQTMEVSGHIANVLNRDYSALMKAIDKKKR